MAHIFHSVMNTEHAINQFPTMKWSSVVFLLLLLLFSRQMISIESMKRHLASIANVKLNHFISSEKVKTLIQRKANIEHMECETRKCQMPLGASKKSWMMRERVRADNENKIQIKTIFRYVCKCVDILSTRIVHRIHHKL